MNKNESLNILDECIVWLENASDSDVKKMREIYQKEIEKDSETIVLEKIKSINLDYVKVKPYMNKQKLNYKDKEFNESALNSWEHIAA